MKDNYPNSRFMTATSQITDVLPRPRLGLEQLPLPLLAPTWYSDASASSIHSRFRETVFADNLTRCVHIQMLVMRTLTVDKWCVLFD